jgi:hypothetical protein
MVFEETHKIQKNKVSAGVAAVQVESSAKLLPGLAQRGALTRAM